MAPMLAKKRFGLRAIEKGFVKLEQVIEALGIQTRESVETGRQRPIGEILLDLGYISRSQIYDVLEERFEPRFGDLAVSRGLVTVEQLIKAMSLQVREEAEKDRHRLLGEILVELGFMDAADVQKILKDMKTGKK